MQSGIATLVGRPNVGKSTLLNRMLGHKVSIVSDKPQTTRHRVHGVLNLAGAQVVFVDTPGIHKPRTLLGQRLNEAAADALAGIDVAVFVIDATAPFGTGDRFVGSQLPPERTIVAVNKVDAASKSEVAGQLAAVGELDASAYFPVSARTGAGVPDLVAAIVDRMPEGEPLYPADMITDVPDAIWVAELVREQLLAATREELPYSIATRVVEWEWPLIRVEILVERESQKGMVIGKGGALLKQVGQAVRHQLPPGAYLELRVKVDKDWQRRPAALDRILNPER